MSDTPARDYLAEFDAAAHDDKHPLVREWMHSEPLPFFKQLRAQRPVLVTPETTLVTLFEDVRDVLQMPKIFTVDLYKSKMGVTDTEVGYLMAHDDDALHYREKSIMRSGWTTSATGRAFSMSAINSNSPRRMIGISAIKARSNSTSDCRSFSSMSCRYTTNDLEARSDSVTKSKMPFNIRATCR